MQQGLRSELGPISKICCFVFQQFEACPPGPGYLGVSPIENTGISFKVNMLRLVLQVCVLDPPDSV